MDLYEELRSIVGALDSAGVPYALVGGLAVSVYATPRATEDIDILISSGDADRAILALLPLGFRAPGPPFAVAGGCLRIVRLLKFEGGDLLPLDLLAPVDPALAPLLSDRVVHDLGGRPVAVVGLRSLRALKRLRRSPQDMVRSRSARPRGTIGGRSMTGDARSAAAKIRAVARLRDLCRRLPHVPTETERRLLDRFRNLSLAPATARPEDVDALAAGWREWWREQRPRDIAVMADALPPGLVDADRRLATYALAAQLACGVPP